MCQGASLFVACCFPGSQSTALKFNILPSFISAFGFVHSLSGIRPLPVSGLPAGKKVATPGFRYFFIPIRAMLAAITTAKTPFEEEMFGEHHVAVLIIIEINPLLQRLRHQKAALSGASLSGPPVVQI